MSESIAALETQLAFLEDTVSNLDAALVAQQRALLELQGQVRMLHQQLKEQGARIDEAGGTVEPPPPHY
jgi:uncharacterized coiled-coil protein SlyX